MTWSASQAVAFYQEVASSLVVGTIRDSGGFAAPMGADERRAQPFWSSRSRAERITVAAYANFTPVDIAWAEFRDKWAPGLPRDGILAGVNWSGDRATGYDLEATEVVRNVEALVLAPRARR